MYQGVTLGGYRFKTDKRGELLRGYKRHPTIEDDVIIYANASILGPVTVGEGSIIGASVILTESVEPGTADPLDPGRKGGGPSPCKLQPSANNHTPGEIHPETRAIPSFGPGLNPFYGRARPRQLHPVEHATKW